MICPNNTKDTAGSDYYVLMVFLFFFFVQVPGLAENRPSVVRGDQILVRMKDNKGQLEKEEYQGFVHILGLNDVHLKFSPK